MTRLTGSRRAVEPMSRGFRLALAAWIVVAGNAGAAETTTECVVLLHGLARSADSMQRMAEALQDDGYVAVNVDYPSRKYRIEQLAPLAVGEGLRRCRNRHAADQIHFVTHSLGGILLRQYAVVRDIDGMGRAVMLGPPNQGSRAADVMRNVPGFGWLNGPAGFQLGKGSQSVPRRLGKPAFEFAVIAGDRSIDPITSAVLDNPDDGRVSVSDTRLEGMSDFRVLHVSHAFMMRDRDVIQLVRHYLRHGRFPAPELVNAAK